MQFAVNKAEFKLGVGHDDAAPGGVGAPGLVDGKRGAFDLGGGFRAEQVRSLSHADVFIVLAQFGLGGGRKQRRFQLVGFAQVGGQLVAAQGAGGLVILPAGAGDVAAHNAFHRQGLGLAHDDGAAFKLVLPGCQSGGEAVHIAFNQVIGDDVLELFHPEKGDLIKNHALVGDGFVHDHVKGRHAVSGDNEQCFFVHIIDVAHFPARKKGIGADLGFYHDFHDGS